MGKPDQFVPGETEAERKPHWPGKPFGGAPAQHGQHDCRAGNPDQQRDVGVPEQRHPSILQEGCSKIKSYPWRPEGRDCDPEDRR
jgi:hypothetical protein